jgi:hypothetical protein
MNKKLIRLTENDLHRIVKESVNRVIIEEGFGDKISGAIQGFRTGKNLQDVNNADSDALRNQVDQIARDGIGKCQRNDIQGALNAFKQIIGVIRDRTYAGWAGQ